ncbi:MAG: hypothetical protein AAF589_04675 [Planctomycetota bacterium]
MKPPRDLLWMDGLAGLVAGVVVLPLSGVIAAWHDMPHGWWLFNGAMNLVYASYSLAIARMRRRSLGLVTVIAAGNLLWAGVCVAATLWFRPTATPLGLAHLLLEAAFVGALGATEWRLRRHLVRSQPGI